MAAIKDLFKGASTEAKLTDVQKRLRDINTELDSLNLGTAPTADLEVEEANALKRLARKEALGRVSSALSAEQAELMAQLAKEKEAERQRQAVRAQADVNAAKDEFIEALWVAYELIHPWQVSCNELDKVAPEFYPRINGLNEVVLKLGHLLELLGSGTVTQDETYKKIVTRISA